MRFPRLSFRQALILLGASAALLLGGCAANFRDIPDVDFAVKGQTPIGSLHGSAYGGQQPIYNSHIYLMAANTSGYGGASVSLLTASGNTYADTTVLGTPANPAYYVTTDANGGFNITGDYTCTYNATTPSQSQLLYIYSIGGVNNYLAGNPTTTGTNNPMAGLMATLGSCPSSGTFAGHLAFIYLNEVSTIATAYAVAGFATSAHNISSASTALSQLGLFNAFANANQLYDIQSSVPGHEARTTTPGTGTVGTVPRALLDTLANILAACVNQSNTTLPPTSGACLTIYNATGSATDTASAAISIANNPGSNVSALYALQSSNVQFADNLTSAPKDFSVGITFTGTGLNNPVDVAIDGSGNAWVTSSSGYLSSLTPLGAHASGSPFTVPTANYVAIDSSGNAWATSSGGNKVYGISKTGSVLTPLTNSNYSAPAGLAFDGSGNPYVASVSGPTGLLNLNAAGNLVGGASNLLYEVVNLLLVNQLPGVSQVAVDSAGYVWASGDPVSCFLLSCGGANVQRVKGSNLSSGGVAFTANASSGTPEGVAIDSLGNGWVAVNGGSDSLFKVTSSGASTQFTGGGLNNPQGVAVDGSGNVFVANMGNSSISEFSSGGTAVTGTSGFTGGTMSVPTNLDVDLSGNLWLVNSTGNSVTELIGIATPVVRPLSSAVSLSKLGSEP